MKTICFLGYNEPDGKTFGNGVARVAFNQAKMLRERGYKVIFYHLFSKEEFQNLNAFLSDNSVDIALWHMTTLKIRRRLHTPCPLVCLWHNTPFMSSDNYAEGFCNKYHVGSFVRRVLCGKLVSAALSKMHDCFNALVFTYVTARSDKMVLLSEKFIPGFFAAKLFPKKVIAISNMVDASNGEFCLEKKKHEVLFVGRLDNKQKRVDLLLKIWAKVENECKDWNLNVCGDGPDRATLEQLSVELNLQRLHFCGFVTPDEYYKTASVICMTSAHEGLPMVIEEAASFGCVPMAFDSFESVTDLITDGVNGRVIKAFDVDAYSSALKELLVNEKLRNELADNAYNDVKRFDPEMIMDKWETLFNSLVKQW